MSFMSDNQILFLLAFLFAGTCTTVLIALHPARLRAWQLADILWVVLGAFGAIAAVLAGIYKTDSSRIDRQIDIAYAATNAFDRDAARFRLQYCEGARGADLHVLCDRVEFLSASTAGNAELPLFIAVTETAAPLQGLHLLPRKTTMTGMDGMDDMDLAAMVQEANAFDPVPFLAFVAQDDATRGAVERLRPTRPAIAADYQVLAGSYEGLIAQVAKLKQEWEFLQDNAGILLVQVIALCMVAFAMPLRLGKAIADMRRLNKLARMRDRTQS